MATQERKIKHQEFVKLYAEKMKCSESTAELYLEGLIETLYDSFKEGSSVTIQNFGNFYVARTQYSTAFKFNPAQKLKALFGWASSYRGKV